MYSKVTVYAEFDEVYTVCVGAVCIHSGHITSNMYTLSCDLYVQLLTTYDVLTTAVEIIHARNII